MNVSHDTARHCVPAERAALHPRAWFTLILLLALYLCSMIDRNIINILVLPIKDTLRIDDAEMGLLMGPAFGLAYIVLAFPLAWLADRWSRRGVVFLGIVTWSVSNVAAGLTHSFEALFFARVGIGAGEAALVPSAYVLISQLFPRRSLSLALSIFSIGSIGGMAVSFGLGGWLLDVLDGGREVPIFGHLDAWRLVFFLTGIPSLILALLLWFVPEGVSGVEHVDAGQPGISLMTLLRRHPWPVLGIPVAFGLVSLCSATLLAWLPSYMMPRFAWSATTVGLMLAATIAIVGTIGKLGSGLLVDRLFASGMKDAHPRYLLLALIVALPMTVIAFYCGPVFFVALMSFWFLLANPLQGYGAAAMQVITPVELRGRTSAIFIIIINIFAAAIGPSLAGFLSESVFEGDLRSSMVAVLVTVVPIAMAVLWITLPRSRQAVDENAEH